MNLQNPAVIDALAARRSCRAYLEKPVPAEVLRAVFLSAVTAPSAENSQPWEVYVLTGTALKAQLAEIAASLEKGDTASVRMRRDTAARRARARELSAAMKSSLAGQGWQGREFIQRCLRFFDAPAAAVICADEPVEPFHSLDIGMFVQNLCLAAGAYGLGTCILGYPLIAEPALRRFLKLPEERRILITAALGYPDEGAPMANFRSSRVPLEKNIHFLDKTQH
jgi:nitroreductase